MSIGTSSADRARARGIFLDELAKTGNVTASARTAGFDRDAAYKWREAEPDFRDAWESAIESATDALESEARRRAVDGWTEPVFQNGGEVGQVRRYSDRMLEILLKGHRPSFRENHRVEVSGPGGGPVQVTTLVDLIRKAEKDDAGA